MHLCTMIAYIYQAWIEADKLASARYLVSPFLLCIQFLQYLFYAEAIVIVTRDNKYYELKG